MWVGKGHNFALNNRYYNQVFYDSEFIIKKVIIFNLKDISVNPGG